ncbi:hypothetical protein ADK67_47435 [Saccharothrix sp. NRRL B-16348]|nr:hypothetical protein ADK67_47435 [Saccharothrix sp. NRRL B-16348]
MFLREFENDYDAHQYWYWDPGAGTFRNQASGQCLTADGTAVRQTPCRIGTEDQQWNVYVEATRSRDQHRGVALPYGCIAGFGGRALPPAGRGQMFQARSA